MAAGPGRSLSTTAKEAVVAATTSEVALAIVEIDHTDLGSPIRVVNNTANITSNGDVYTAFPFMIELPDDDEDQLSKVMLQIDNVDRTIVTAVRSMTNTEQPTAALSIILADSPDTIEAGPFYFTVKNCSYDKESVFAELAYEDILNERFPKDSQTPQNVPGMF